MYDSIYTTTDLSSLAPAIPTGSLLFSGFLGIFGIICLWIVFKKAGKPGWTSIVPIYNIWVLLEIVGMKGAFSLLILIPFVGVIIVGILTIIAYYKLAEKFGKSSAFGVGLIFLGYIFIAILAFDKNSIYKLSKN